MRPPLIHATVSVTFHQPSKISCNHVYDFVGETGADEPNPCQSFIPGGRIVIGQPIRRGHVDAYDVDKQNIDATASQVDLVW